MTAAARSESLGSKAWRKFRKDRVGVAALCVVLVYLVAALGAMLGWRKSR